MDITDEPKGTAYRGLVSGVSDYADRALLVVRPELGLTPKAQALLMTLEPFLIGREWAPRWPGTELLTGQAEILTYRIEDDLVDLLSQSVNGLYEWKQPDAPEDLAFLRPDGSEILATIAHERDAYLRLRPDELESLLKGVPILSSHLGRRASSRSDPG